MIMGSCNYMVQWQIRRTGPDEAWVNSKELFSIERESRGACSWGGG